MQLCSLADAPFMSDDSVQAVVAAVRQGALVVAPMCALREYAPACTSAEHHKRVAYTNMMPLSENKGGRR